MGKKSCLHLRVIEETRDLIFMSESGTMNNTLLLTFAASKSFVSEIVFGAPICWTAAIALWRSAAVIPPEGWNAAEFDTGAPTAGADDEEEGAGVVVIRAEVEDDVGGGPTDGPRTNWC